MIVSWQKYNVFLFLIDNGNEVCVKDTKPQQKSRKDPKATHGFTQRKKSAARSSLQLVPEQKCVFVHRKLTLTKL